jgi:3-oxoacyl-[acyl-carrier protein] reductase
MSEDLLRAPRPAGAAFHRRTAEREQVAEAVAIFASEPARFVTGAMLSVSGGIRPHL